MKPLHISLNTAHSGCKPSAFISSFTHSYQVFLPLPEHLATTTFLQADTQSSHSYIPHAQTTSIYPASPPHQCSVHPKDCTNPHCVSYPSATLRTSISPSSVLSSPDFADSLSSSSYDINNSVGGPSIKYVTLILTISGPSLKQTVTNLRPLKVYHTFSNIRL